MPEMIVPLHTCEAFVEKAEVKFPKALCYVPRATRHIVGIYVLTDHGRIIPGPIEYQMDEIFLGDFPYNRPLCIDVGGRNHGLQVPVYVSHHDMNRFVIQMSMFTGGRVLLLERQLL